MTGATHLVLSIYRERGESEEMVEKIQFDSIQFNGWPERERGRREYWATSKERESTQVENVYGGGENLISQWFVGSAAKLLLLLLIKGNVGR